MSSGIGVNVGSHCQRSGETLGTIYDCNFRSSERPRRRRRRNRCSPRRCTKRRSQRSGLSHRGVSHREGRQDQGMSDSIQAGNSCWNSGGTSHWRCRKSDGADEVRGRSRRQWTGRRSREGSPSIESGSVKENDGGDWQLFFRILEKLEESCSLARRAVRAARAAFHSHPRS